MAYNKEYPVANSELEKDSIFEYTKRQEDRIGDSINVIKDFIVDYGSNDNGNWEKWESGKLIMWGAIMASEANTDFSHVTPIKFTGDTSTAISTMNLQLTVNRAGGYNKISVQGKGFTSDKQGFIYRVNKDGDVNLVPVHWRFTGKWK